MKKLLLIFLISYALPVLPQIPVDSLEYSSLITPVNILSTRFDKQINIYNLNSVFRYSGTFGRAAARVLENYNSTFILSGQKNIRDEQHLQVSGAYKFSDYISAGLLGTSSVLSDNRQIELNQASINNASVFLHITPYEKLLLSPFAGYSNNRQVGENDNGYVYGAEGNLDSLSMNDMLLSSSFKFKNEDISPRKNTLRYFNAAAANSFNEDVSNNLEIRYSLNRKDFYYNEDDSVVAAFYNITNNIESRTETAYMVQDMLSYNNFLSVFRQELLGGIAWRDIDRDKRYKPREITSASAFDPRIKELRFEFESNTYYSSGIFNGQLKISLSERDEKHLAKRIEGANNIFYEERAQSETSKNNNAARTAVSLTGNLNLSSRDRIAFSLLQNKLRYDTPSSLNFDDRDELLSIARIRYSRQLTPFMEWFVNAEGTYSHIVYIFAEKSSNNYVNRIISLSSGGYYRGKYFSSYNNFEVTANYTVYDFESLLSNSFRSFSFRQFTAVDSSSLRLNNLFSFSFYGYLKYSEQGDFNWTAFSTKPSRFLQEIYSEPKIILTSGPLMVAAGLRIFSLNSYNFKGREKVIDTKYLSTGPLAELLIKVRQSLYLRFYGWYEFITIKDSPGRELVNANLQLNWLF